MMMYWRVNTVRNGSSPTLITFSRVNHEHTEALGNFTKLLTRTSVWEDINSMCVRWNIMITSITPPSMRRIRACRSLFRTFLINLRKLAITSGGIEHRESWPLGIGQMSHRFIASTLSVSFSPREHLLTKPVQFIAYQLHRYFAWNCCEYHACYHWSWKSISRCLEKCTIPAVTLLFVICSWVLRWRNYVNAANRRRCILQQRR